MGRYGLTRMPTVIPTITAGPYSAGDVIGGLMAFPIEAASGVLVRIVIDDADNEKAAMTLWFYDSAPTTILDNAAFSTLADVDNAKCLGFVDLAATDYKTAGSGNAVLDKAVRKGLVLVGSGTLYVYAVLVGTPTYGATNDLVFRLEIWPD
jgi:hypothetical protein